MPAVIGAPSKYEIQSWMEMAGKDEGDRILNAKEYYSLYHHDLIKICTACMTGCQSRKEPGLLWPLGQYLGTIRT